MSLTRGAALLVFVVAVGLVADACKRVVDLTPPAGANDGSIDSLPNDTPHHDTGLGGDQDGGIDDFDADLDNDAGGALPDG